MVAHQSESSSWEECCNLALFGDEWKWLEEFEEEEIGDETRGDFDIQIIDLLDHEKGGENGSGSLSGKEDSKEKSSADNWTENAYRIHDSLQIMKDWMSTKSFVSVHIPEEEASLFQSTVTSFLAATAKEIETLRSMVDTRAADAGHKSGVCASLLVQLQEDIAQPLARLQKLRSRVAVSIWQHPIQCSLYRPTFLHERSEDSFRKNLLQDQDDAAVNREERFSPKRRNAVSLELSQQFAKSHIGSSPPEIRIPQRPDFIQLNRHDQVPQTRTRDDSQEPKHVHTIPQQGILAEKRKKAEQQYQEELSLTLQQESVLLQATMQNDLDSVQLIEQRMVDITALISQFSNLVSDQQEEIWQIHEAAQDTKENITRGQENLVDAADRANSSRHYKATIISFLSLALLFFHFLKA
jgi:hypothetical protein